MRLTQIKLSGFKSFVDPTHFQIPGQLIGVVGPNGCGKSNIIDAARWVLGESKASELRGESMQDVIFNGSGNRKPAGRASVELVFDNSSGRAGGQWGQYAEIAVKRVLTRDGTSNYYINSQVVRRRDIQDIFLGTGLGPRAYAIIGQGMITRIIEARPEELRVFLEEAAGVSKYKERRRETENRLSDTRENLVRVEDIQRELTANLDKLEQQATVAQRYRDIEAEQGKKQQWLWLIKSREAKDEQGKAQRLIEEAQVALEARIADLRRSEAELEALRASHYSAGDAVHGAQGGLYQASSVVSTIEAEIRYVIDSRNRLEQQALLLAGQKRERESQRSGAAAEQQHATEQLEQVKYRQEEFAARLDDAAAALPAAEEHERARAAAVDLMRAEVGKVEQSLQLESAAQRNADRQLQALAQRRERLAAEKHLLAAPDREAVDELSAEVEHGEHRLAGLSEALERQESELPRLDMLRGEASEASLLDAQNLAQKEARLAALKQLQESVQANDKVAPWLAKHELAGLPRLWQRLQVDSGWETALEAVLRERIAALELKDLNWASAFFQDAPPAKMAFFSTDTGPVTHQVPVGLTALIDKVRFTDANLRGLLEEWLAGIFIADSASDALARRATLPAGGSFVVPAGHLIDRHAARFYASDSEQAGMLARQQEIESLIKEVRALRLIADQSKSRSIQIDAQLAQARVTLQQRRNETQGLTQSLHQRQLALQEMRSKQAQVEQRSTQLSDELAEIAQSEAAERGAHAESQARFEELDLRLAHTQGAFEDGQLLLEDAQAKLRAARDNLRELERELAEEQFQERSLRQQLEALARSIDQASQDGARLGEAHSSVQLELEGLSDAAAKAGLQDALAKRVVAEQHLAEARTALDALGADLRAKDEVRLLVERDLEPLRAGITDTQLREQAARLAFEQAGEQLAQLTQDMAALELEFDAIDKRPRGGALQSELNRLAQELASLGAVNLAALDELGSARDRKTFLDAQSLDLNEAMTTLEDAIRKIDRETRSLLQDTFDAVNGHFGTLFPALFGGGEARLVMTGDEILDSGVQVMAQPPGKKNSTIHLLSGGEKALTATALVFALFQLNPAPFCLLDEVDAPLDDANTERFCNLVKQMSTHTQFLFISHNKIAMEMAHQLIGVTMQEQGVSRIVAVDMDAAAGLALEGAESIA